MKVKLVGSGTQFPVEHKQSVGTLLLLTIGLKGDVEEDRGDLEDLLGDRSGGSVEGGKRSA